MADSAVPQCHSCYPEDGTCESALKVCSSPVATGAEWQLYGQALASCTDRRVTGHQVG